MADPSPQDRLVAFLSGGRERPRACAQELCAGLPDQAVIPAEVFAAHLGFEGRQLFCALLRAYATLGVKDKDHFLAIAALPGADAGDFQRLPFPRPERCLLRRDLPMRLRATGAALPLGWSAAGQRVALGDLAERRREAQPRVSSRELELWGSQDEVAFPLQAWPEDAESWELCHAEGRMAAVTAEELRDVMHADERAVDCSGTQTLEERWDAIEDAIIERDAYLPHQKKKRVPQWAVRAAKPEPPAFDLSGAEAAWRQVACDAIRNDVLLPSQEQLIAYRATHVPSAKALATRTRGVPPRFFEEVLPQLDREQSVARMRERHARDRAQEEAQRDARAEQGAKWTCWPAQGRWPRQAGLIGSSDPWPASAEEQKRWRDSCAQRPRKAPASPPAAGTGLRAVRALTESDSDHEGPLDLDAELAKALSALEAAEAALNTLCKADITELKALGKPPVGVHRTLEAVCVLFQRKATWKEAKMLLGDPRMIQQLLEFDKDNISDATIAKLKPYLSDESLHPDRVKMASVACYGLMKWVHAMAAYNGMCKKVQKFRADLGKKEQDLAATQRELQAKQLALQELQQQQQLEADTAAVALELAAQDPAARALRRAELAASLAAADEDLQQARPALGAAERRTRAALAQLGDLAELAAFARPPPAVLPLAEALCLVVGRQPQWPQAQELLGREALREELAALDAGGLSAMTRKALAKHIAQHKLAPEAVAPCSVVASHLCEWVLAINAHAAATSEVAEQEQRCAGLRAALAELEGQAPDARAAAAELRDRLASLFAVPSQKRSVQELKSLAKPPAGVAEVLKACGALLRTEKVTDWKQCQKLMGNPEAFLREMQDLDALTVTSDRLCRAIALSRLATVEDVRRKSVAAAFVLEWTQLTCELCRLVRGVPEPDRPALARPAAAPSLAELEQRRRRAEQRVGSELEHGAQTPEVLAEELANLDRQILAARRRADEEAIAAALGAAAAPEPDLDVLVRGYKLCAERPRPALSDAAWPSSAALCELKCLAKPPAECVHVCECVARLLGETGPFTWQRAQVLLGQSASLGARVAAFDPERVPERCLKLAEKLCAHDWFTYGTLARKSTAAAGLCAWAAAATTAARAAADRRVLGDRLAQVVRTMQEDCQTALAPALPALEHALGALRLLRTSDLAEVAAVKRPPDSVLLVSKALCWLFGIPPKKAKSADGGAAVDDYWEAARRSVWGDARLLQRIVSFDKDHIPPATMAKVRPLATDPRFDPEVVQKASVAAVAMCRWVHALIGYDAAAQAVAPKRQQLAAATEQLGADATEAKRIDALQRQLAAAAGPTESGSDQEGPLDLDAELAKALPALQAAEAGLNMLCKADITELKAFCQPPNAVVRTLEAVCVLFQREATWKEAKMLLGDSRMIQHLLEFDGGNISDATIAKLKPYLSDESLHPDRVAMSSKACCGLMKWVHAMAAYNGIFKTVQKALKLRADLEKTEGEIPSPEPAEPALLAPGDQPARAPVALGDLAELASFVRPPAEVARVCVAADLLLGGEPDQGWAQAQRRLRKPYRMRWALAHAPPPSAAQARQAEEMLAEAQDVKLKGCAAEALRKWCTEQCEKREEEYSFAEPEGCCDDMPRKRCVVS